MNTNAQPTADELIRKALELKDHIATQAKAFEEYLKPFQDGIKTLENALLEKLNKENQNNFNTDSGTCYKSEIMNVKVLDRNAFLKIALDNWESCGSDMLHVGTVKDGVKKFIEANDKPPPGLEISFFTKVNIRRSA